MMAKQTSPIKTKDWELNQEALDALLCWLDKDRERAGSIYENIRAGLIKFFEFQRCLIYEECADETIKRAARKIYEGEVARPERPHSYFHGIAWNILREYRKSRERKLISIEEMPETSKFSLDASFSQSKEDERKELELKLECLDECLNSLTAEERAIYIEYHTGEPSERINNRSGIAAKLGIALNNLRIRIFRLSNKLEKCVRDCAGKLPEKPR